MFVFIRVRGRNFRVSTHNYTLLLASIIFCIVKWIKISYIKPIVNDLISILHEMNFTMFAWTLWLNIMLLISPRVELEKGGEWEIFDIEYFSPPPAPAYWQTLVFSPNNGTSGRSLLRMHRMAHVDRELRLRRIVVNAWRIEEPLCVIFPRDNDPGITLHRQTGNDITSKMKHTCQLTRKLYLLIFRENLTILAILCIFWFHKRYFATRFYY